MVDLIFEIDTDGNLHCLYTDKINLFSIGRVTDVRKASNVEFNENIQRWEVCNLNGIVLHTNPNRKAAIEWEIEAFSPSGPHCIGNKTI